MQKKNTNVIPGFVPHDAFTKQNSICGKNTIASGKVTNNTPADKKIFYFDENNPQRKFNKY